MNVWHKRVLKGLASVGLSSALLNAALMAQSGSTVAIGSISGLTIKPPKEGALHSAFVDTQDNVPSPAALLAKARNFERLTGQKLQMVSFQTNWAQGMKFPTDAVESLHGNGYLSMVRVLPVSDAQQDTGRPDPIFDLRAIARGDFDQKLSNYLRSVAGMKGKDGQPIPVMISFAPEVNGSWYRYNGAHYGAGETDRWGDKNYPDGPEIFRDAYRRIIEISRRSDVNAKNVTWAIHFDSQAKPAVAWNAMKNYYPGDFYIDWIGLSVFGAQELPDVEWYDSFEDVIFGDSATQANRWTEFLNVSNRAAKGLFEFGVIEDPAQACRKADWIRKALRAIPQRFKEFKLVNYWHESAWDAQGFTDQRLDSSACALEAYKSEIKANHFQATIAFDQPSDLSVPARGTFFSCEQNVRSWGESNTPLSAIFKAGSKAFEVVWVDAKGKESSIGFVQPGTALTVKTYAGHAFAIKVGGKCSNVVKAGLRGNDFNIN